MGLTANAQKESGFKAQINGDPRSDVGGNGDLAIKVGNNYYCSFGLWQLNVCASGGGGQRFAKQFNIDLEAPENRTPDGELYKAITNEDKQFRFVASDLKPLYESNKSTVTTAEGWGKIIAVKFEICRECKPVGHTSGRYQQTVARGNIAAGLEEDTTLTRKVSQV